MASRGGLFIGPLDQPDRWELVSVLDSTGGEGVVWRGVLNGVDPPADAAIKIYHRDESVDDAQMGKSLARLDEMVARLRSIRHPGLAGIHDPFIGAPGHTEGQPDPEANQVLCLPMTYIDGVDFADWCDEVTAVGARLSMLSNVAHALDEMHAAGVIHADVKPSNIRIEARLERSVLVDYGLVRVAGGGRTRKVGGTPGYWAPEVQRGIYSAASDLYAFACTIVFAVSGENPPVDSNLTEQWAREHLRRAHFPTEAVDAVLRALAPDPASRDPELTASSLLRQARRTRSTSNAEVVAGGPASPPPVPPVRSQPDSGPRRSRVLATILLAAVVGGGLLWWFLGRDTDGGGVDASPAPSEVATTSEETFVATTSPPATVVATTVQPETTGVATVPTTTTTTLPPPPPQTPPTFLEELEVIEDSFFIRDEWTPPVESFGVSYDRAVVIDFSKCETQVSPSWSLGRDYSSFYTVVGLNTDQAYTDTIARVQIATETGAELWAGEVNLTSQIPVTVPVDAALRLIITVTNVDGANDCGIGSANNWVVLGDAQLLPSGSEPVISGEPKVVSNAFLDEMRPVEDGYYILDDRLPIDSSGATYDHGAVVDFSGCEGNPQPSWNLARGYKWFRAVIGLNDELATTDALARVRITTESGADLWVGNVDLTAVT